MGAVRIVCPKLAEDPRGHLDVTLATPLSCEAVGFAFVKLGRCVCGAEMQLASPLPATAAAPPAVPAAPSKESRSMRAEHCLLCGSDNVPTRDGLLENHLDPQQKVCRGTGRVPWRKGRPSDDVVRRHMQEHEAADVPAAFFQGTYLGCFHFILTASELSNGDISWEFLFPRDAKNKTFEGCVAVPGPESASAWWMRPFDLDSGEPRPWLDSDEGA